MYPCDNNAKQVITCLFSSNYWPVWSSSIELFVSLSKSKPKSKASPSAAADLSESVSNPSAVKDASTQDVDLDVNHARHEDNITSDELSFVHDAVLLQETVAAVLGVKSLPKQTEGDQNSLNISGIYVDATFGRGGHSRLLLSQLADDATLIVFDKDPTAISVAQELANKDSRVRVVHDSFATLTDSLAAMGISEVNGLMADLGISSPQIDDGSRGFSFMRDGAVDMRMDTIGKALTGGYMTFAATLCTRKISDTIHNSDYPALMHGPTFMGNPLACAVACASIDLIMSYDIETRTANMQRIMEQQLASAELLEGVAEVRCLGAVAVIELHEAVDMPTFQSLLIDNGIWVRPFGKLVYIMPPYMITDDELTTLCQSLLKVVRTYLENRGQP